MEKIRLKNGQEFDIIPMGISQTEKRRSFKVVSALAYEEIKSIFLNVTNLENIDYILADGAIDHTYLDCVALKGLGTTLNYQVDENTTADIYTVELSTDAVEKQLQTLKDNVTYTELALVEIYEAMLGGV